MGDAPVIVRVVRVEALPPGSRGSRRLVCAWSDGAEREAITFYDDEILVTEGDLVGLTLDEVRGLHGRRDREYLQRED